MRFVCDSCRAQYMISDDKVGANGVKVRCKKCGNVIVVRRAQDAEAEAALRSLEESAPPPPGPEAPTGENSIFSDVDDEEIGAAFESALGERQDQLPPPQEDQPPVEANLPPVSDGPPRAHDWYVAIDEKQTGPLTPEAIKDHWDQGEIGPDSLTWRQGFEDWVPLSEVSELAGWLAPRPQRPVFSPASSPSGPMPVVSVPVESAFSAGGVTRTVRAEVPTPVPDAGGWKPSASAALASLVKDEIDALNKPDAPPPAPEPSPAPRGLLEVPPPTGEVPAASINGRPSRTGSPTPVTHVERPPTFTPAYPYATRPVKPQGNTGVLIGIVVAVAVVLAAVGGGGWYLLQRQKASELAARQTPPPTEPPRTATAPPEPAKAAPAQPPATTQPVIATPSVTPPVAPPVAKVTPAVPPGETGGTRRGTRGSRSHGGGKASGGGEDAVASAEPAKSSGGGKSKADDLFDEVFGTGGGSVKSDESRGKKNAYIPPAPGASSTEVPERLPKGDIMSVVLANKPSIVRCVNEQKARDANLHGTLVMHWVIQTSGKTASVNAVTDQFKSSYMATCLSGLVKSWNFPKHKYQPGEPVDFPFTF
ncbi:MAG TPA: adventurous gliding motility protein GltJ [Myxococcaceae bacterium]|nr:adventurous gliding motility protein GltJ [Myxococcaceae bacterium]